MSKKIFHMKIKRIFCGALAVGMLLGQTSSVLAEAVSSPTPTPNPLSVFFAQAADTDSFEGWPTGPQIEAQSAVLMDLNSEAILYSKNADTQLYPASITKLLTCLLGCENLDTSAQITLSQQAAYGIEAGSSTIYGDAGEVFTVEQALMGLMLESANEMALAIGEEVSGSVKKFVELMNARAQQLGCTNTHFANSSGLPDDNHYSSASNGLASHWYGYERGTTVYSGNATTWKGKIGLMYPSDYGYATSGGTTKDRNVCLAKELYNWDSSDFSGCKENDYLYNSSLYQYQWTLAPYSADSDGVFAVRTVGSVYDRNANLTYAVHPVLFLKSNVLIKSGTGESSSPYQLQLGID